MKRISFYRKPIAVLFVLIFIASPLFCFSWGVTGHRVVAEIAQRHLSKKTRKQLKKFMGSESLQQWANWPDFIKSDSSWSMASPWHYVNLPGGLDKEHFMTALKALPGPNLYTKIQEMQSQVRDKSLPAEKRHIALNFLVHFIGDLHQPLHVGREADQGGNRVKVTWFDKETNLHSVWDVSLIDFQQYSFSEYAKTLDIADENTIASWENSSLEEWFWESYQLANKVYASVPADGKLGYKYNWVFKEDLDRQLLKGGLRLAKMIREALQ